MQKRGCRYGATCGWSELSEKSGTSIEPGWNNLLKATHSLLHVPDVGNDTFRVDINQ